MPCEPQIPKISKLPIFLSVPNNVTSSVWIKAEDHRLHRLFSPGDENKPVDLAVKNFISSRESQEHPLIPCHGSGEVTLTPEVIRVEERAWKRGLPGRMDKLIRAVNHTCFMWLSPLEVWTQERLLVCTGQDFNDLFFNTSPPAHSKPPTTTPFMDPPRQWFPMAVTWISRSCCFYPSRFYSGGVSVCETGRWSDQCYSNGVDAELHHRTSLTRWSDQMTRWSACANYFTKKCRKSITLLKKMGMAGLKLYKAFQMRKEITHAHTPTNLGNKFNLILYSHLLFSIYFFYFIPFLLFSFLIYSFIFPLFFLVFFSGIVFPVCITLLYCPHFAVIN